MATKSDKTTCPICGKEDVISRAHATKDVFSYECPVCGTYAMVGITRVKLQGLPPEDKTKVSAVIRERNIHEIPMVTIVSGSPGERTSNGPVVRIEDILNTFPRTVSDRLDRALKNIYRLTRHPSARILLSPMNDYPVLFAENDAAFLFFRNALKDTGLIEVDNTVPDLGIMLTVQGWNRIAELGRQRVGRDSKQAFVAMWFDSSLDKAYTDGFEKATKAAGYEPLRVDLKEHNEKICDVIIAEIRKNRLMVADFTGQRSGVFFEAGYALGLDIPVIWTCREDQKHKLKRHFDTRQYNHVLWKNESDLYEKLRRRIEAMVPVE